jgi:hypothetical protein
MFYLNQKEIFSLLTAVKYTHKQNASYDYLHSPRPCYNFLFMLDGTGIIDTGKEIIPLKRGDILFIPKGTTYKSVWEANPLVHFHSIHFNFLPNIDPFALANIPIQKIKNVDFDEVYKLVESFHENQYARNQNSFIALSSFLAVCGKLFEKTVFSEDGMLKQGVVVRHMIMPLGVKDSKTLLDWFAKNKQNGAFISLMGQYTPFGECDKYPELKRPITKREYQRVYEHLLSLNITDYFAQELGSASESLDRKSVCRERV